MKYIKTWALLLLTVLSLVQSANASQQAPTPAIITLVTIGTTKITLVQGDITKQNGVDAIVNAANEDFAAWGGVAGAISDASGIIYDANNKPISSNLRNYCSTMPIVAGFKQKCPTGQAVITPAFELEKIGIRNILHAAGPRGENPNKQPLLRDAYQNSLRVAQKNGLKIVAFPAISTNIYGYEINEATQVALAAIKEHIENNPNTFDEIRCVVFSKDDFNVYKRFKDLLLDDTPTEDLSKGVAAGGDVLKDKKDKPTNTGYSTKQYLIGAFGVGIAGFVSWLIYTRFFSHN